MQTKTEVPVQFSFIHMFHIQTFGDDFYARQNCNLKFYIVVSWFTWCWWMSVCVCVCECIENKNQEWTTPHKSFIQSHLLGTDRFLGNISLTYIFFFFRIIHSFNLLNVRIGENSVVVAYSWMSCMCVCLRMWCYEWMYEFLTWASKRLKL